MKGVSSMLKGLFMALIMLIVAAISKAISGRSKKHKDEEYWVCPKCSHWNTKEQKVCEHCGEENHDTSGE